MVWARNAFAEVPPSSRHKDNVVGNVIRRR